MESIELLVYMNFEMFHHCQTMFRAFCLHPGRKVSKKSQNGQKVKIHFPTFHISQLTGIQVISLSCKIKTNSSNSYRFFQFRLSSPALCLGHRALTWHNVHLPPHSTPVPFNICPIHLLSRLTPAPFNFCPVQLPSRSTLIPFNSRPVQLSSHSTLVPFNYRPIQLSSCSNPVLFNSCPL